MDTMTFIRENWKNTARLCRESHDGNIGLPYPYFVPSITGGFNNLFYWDSYFTAQGMLRHGQEALVKSTVDDMLYLIDRYGYMPNGNAKVLMGRSQPPFLSELVRQLYGIYQDPVWLRTAYRILQEEHDFWMKKRQLPCGLNRYGFDDLSPDGIAMGLDVAKRLPGVDFSGKMDAQIAENVMADAESGWDFSPRCMGHQTDCAYVDLNAILYGMENNLTFFAQELGETAEADKWAQAAQRRKKLMRQLLFDGKVYRGRDMTTGAFSPIFSVASFYALWAGVATEAEAASTVAQLPRLEYDFGLANCEPGARTSAFQWDYPNGWAPLHFIAVHGLMRYGYHAEAERIARKYIRAIDRTFAETGTLWEKYNVTDGTLNVTDEYQMPPMLGWTAGVYVDFAALLAGNG